MNLERYRAVHPAPGALQSWLLAVLGLAFLGGGLVAELASH